MLTIEHFTHVPRLTAGRRSFALLRIKAVAETDKSYADLLPPIELALEAQQRVMAQIRRWRTAQEDDAMHEVGATQLDGEVDQCLSALLGIVRGIRAAHGPQTAEAEAAAALEEALFAEGVRPITSLPYVDEHAAVRELLDRAHDDPILAAHVALLHLEGPLARLAELNEAYGAVLTRPERMTYDELRAEDRAAWLELTRVVILVHARFPSSTPADDAARTRLLQPVQDQVDELRKLRARRAGATLLDAEVPDEDGLLDDDDLAEEAGEPTGQSAAG